MNELNFFAIIFKKNHTNQSLTKFVLIFYSCRAMSSKRKSPPTKLEGGGSAIAANNIHQSTLTTQSAQILTSDSLLLIRGTGGGTGGHSPSISSDLGAGSSEPDLDSYRSSSPTSDIEHARTSISGVSHLHDGNGSTNTTETSMTDNRIGGAGENSDYDEPCKKQRLELHSTSPNTFPVSFAIFFFCC